MNPKILDLVEGILGPNFYCWASNFFIKEPMTLDRRMASGFRSAGPWHRTIP